MSESVKLTLSLDRSGMGMVVTTPQGHVLRVPCYGKSQEQKAGELLMHLLAAQAAEARQGRTPTTGTPAAPIAYIIERWMAQGGEAKRVLEMGKHRTFNPDHALELLGAGGSPTGRE